MSTKVTSILVYLMFSLFNVIHASDTLSTYLELKVYSGDSDSVYLTHERYYGLFIKDNCITENYGTTILTSTGCWRRDAHNFLPRFWEIGGNSPSNFIGQVKKEVDAINSAAIAAYNYGGDTIEIDQMYEIDRSIFLLPKNTFLGMSDTVGFKKIDSPKTTLLQTANIGDNKIIVESNEEFRTFQKINIANDISYDSIAGFASYTASIPQSTFGGDTTIFLSGLPVQKSMLAGDSVGLFFSLMTPLIEAPDSLVLKRLILDGNRDSYTLNYDWRVNSSALTLTTIGFKIDGCKFINSASENIFLCGAEMKNCTGENFNGSVLHFSCNTFDRPTEVLYNQFSKINEVGDSLMEHSEGAFTFSANVQNLRVAYNRLFNLNEHGIGIIQNDDMNNEITDNLINSPKETIAYQAFYNFDSTNTIYNNKNTFNIIDTVFKDCFQSPPVLEGLKPCLMNSSLDSPLQLGDTITLNFNSIQIRNTNENYVKCVLPVYNSEYFQLVGMDLNAPNLSEHHSWYYDDDNTMCEGLVFNNGHSDGLNANGNWGYELCAHENRCLDLEIRFVLTNLPLATQSMPCPLEGIQVIYDGELGTWELLPTCEDKIAYYDTEILGRPVVAGDSTLAITTIVNQNEIKVFPNPASDRLFFRNDFMGLPYEIYNIVGVNVQKGITLGTFIDISSLHKGWHIILLKNKEGFTSLRFLKN